MRESTARRPPPDAPTATLLTAKLSLSAARDRQGVRGARKCDAREPQAGAAVLGLLWSRMSAFMRSATCAEDASRPPLRTADTENRMGVSGPKRGHANLIVTMAKAEVFDVLVRNESAFNVPRSAITYRP